MSFSVYPNAPAKLNKKDSMSQMLKRFFPSVEEDAKENEKSITVKAKVLPGLKRNEDKTQKFNIRDLVLNIQQKGFTLEDSVEAVNDALTRLKMESTKKSPFPDIEYDDYIKQVEDEILAHIVQGDEFRNIGNIAEFLYIGDNDELLGDGGYDKDNKLRDYLKKINILIKDEKFYLNNHSEDHNKAKAIKSSIYLLKHLIKEYRRNDTPLDGVSGNTLGVAADNVLIEDLVEALYGLFTNDLAVFFIRDNSNATFYVREEYQNLTDNIGREDDFQKFLYDNFSNTSSTFSYIVVLDEDVEGVETSLVEAMDSIYLSMQSHQNMFNDMNSYITKNPNKMKKNTKDTAMEELEAENNEKKKKELEEEIKHIFTYIKSREIEYNNYLVSEKSFKNIDDVFKSDNYDDIDRALDYNKIEIFASRMPKFRQSFLKINIDERQKIDDYKNILKTLSKEPLTSRSSSINSKLKNNKFPENSGKYVDITYFLLVYFNQIKYKLRSILQESSFLEERVKFDLKEFDDLIDDLFKKFEKNVSISDCLEMINLLLIQMSKVYRVVNKFWIELERPELNTATQKKPMTRYQVSKKISTMSGLKDEYDDLEKEIKINFKLYNKRYMLNFQSGNRNDELNKEYDDKLKEFEIIKKRLDEKLYKDDAGHVKDEFKQQVKVTPNQI